MLDDLASTIAQMSSRVPGGILIFFPSYKLMNDTYEKWTQRGGLKQIQAQKQVFKEPNNASDYQMIIDKYYSAIYEED